MTQTASWRTLVVGCVTGLASIMFAGNGTDSSHSVTHPRNHYVTPKRAP